ncbi:MAG: sugar-binding protein [Eubacteriales bacterium]
MKRKLLSVLLASAMVFSLVACGSSTTTETATTETATEEVAEVVEEVAEAVEEAVSTSDVTIGISMPTQDLQRWNQDGDNMKSEFEAAGYTVDMQYAANDTATQVSQIETMIANGSDVLVIAAIDGESLGTVLDQAEAAGIPIIAYDRLIMGSEAVSYYATFDNYMVGTVQGQYIEETLDLANATETFTMEITAGDPGDNNALYFYQGAIDVLQPYIDNGTIVITSGQTAFADVATDLWSTETAQSRMDSILASYYSDGTNLDIALCSNDSTCLGVVNSLEAGYAGTWPVVTGQDCDVANVMNILEGQQSMSVFKDTRTLAAQTVVMVTQMINGETVDVNDTETYDNGAYVVPSFLCEPVFCDASNYETILIESGYYSLEDLGL